MRVTRNDVARAAGVSPAVVSYVLNDGPRPVSKLYRKRVLAAIEELGYRRNTVARAMRMRKTNSIGLVLPDISIAYFSVLTQRITDVARARSLTIIVATSNGSTMVEREHLTELEARQVDGVILMSVDPAQDLHWAGEMGMPVLVVDRPAVAVESTVAAAEHLLSHGCRRLARLSGPENDLTTRRRDQGWAIALNQHNLGPENGAIKRADLSAESGYGAAIELLSEPERPDGVLIDRPLHASSFLRAAKDLGVAVPGDVSVITCEFGQAGEYTVPRLTSVDSPLDLIALQAVDRILAAAPEDRLLTLDGSDFTLSERESCGLGPIAS
ncbi:LacI family transcriptional regulator [Paenarthrobacter nicotinovorans]|uniref:LacI family DNA-binding transcriptional regulator n=1 Tax=Paenarthrobacter nicotinovorans TaxID=29320 RepID=UPI00277FBC56|nr:LacI family DNA-binding transcriptional regulator [Paenarthrobacter nicotinovorans]MDP9933744.1 LacI family transcriptional regulator [Paenarthrobacter nicotinovorans]